MKIFKYPIELGKFWLSMPSGANMLSAQMQDDRPTLWAMVDPNRELVKVEFEVVGTGHDFDDRHKLYIDTFQQGPFVWHLFEIV